MSLMRSQSSFRLCRTCLHSSRLSQPFQLRCLAQSSARRLGEPQPSAVPDAATIQQANQPSKLEIAHKDPEQTPALPSSRQPNYRDPEIDHGTSTFSPVPKRVMDGSEPGDTTPAAVVSGAPIDLQARTVRIYKPVKPATQSGSWGSHAWRMDWDILSKGHRWENPLMGWQSSADYMQGYKVQFKSKEDAIAFAQKQGYEYYVQEPNERRFVPKAYANNFVHEPKALKHIKTK